MSEQPETIYVRTEGGVVMPMSLPLGEGIADRLAKGHIRRVNEDGTPYEPPAEDKGSDLTNGRPPRPAQSAPKSEWVAYAVHVHGAKPDDAEAATKTDLIELYGRD